MTASLLDSAEARRLWWLVHNGDPTCIVRGAVYDQLKRGYLALRLSVTERAFCVQLAAAEAARLAGVADAAASTTASLLAALRAMKGGAP